MKKIDLVVFPSSFFNRKIVDEDLKDDFFAMARLDTNVWGDLTMGPYIKYRRAHSRQAHDYGANTSIGVSFNYIHNFDFLNFALDL